MAERALERGDVLVVRLPVQRPPGREQEGHRPVVVVGLPWEPFRYPLAIVAPLTTQGGPWVTSNPILYPVLPSGAGGLPRDSVVLLDQVRSVDLGRISKYLGSLSLVDWERLSAGLGRVIQGCS